MNRAEKRREVKKIQKKVKNMPVSKLNAIMEDSVGDALDKGYRNGLSDGWDKGSGDMLNMVERVLREDFGIGAKRFERIKQRVWDELCLEVEKWDK